MQGASRPHSIHNSLFAPFAISSGRALFFGRDSSCALVGTGIFQGGMAFPLDVVGIGFSCLKGVKVVLSSSCMDCYDKMCYDLTTCHR